MLRPLAALLIACAGIAFADNAFDRYVQAFEDQLKERATSGNFQWLDEHPKEKSLAWVDQSVFTTRQNELESPEGTIQDWRSDTYVGRANLDRVRDFLLNYANYKEFFKTQISESHLGKRDGDHFDASLRLRQRQLVDGSAQYTPVDPTRAYIVFRSTHIAEPGSLSRLNLYWELESGDNGVYVELEQISLSLPPHGMSAKRLIKNEANLPRDLLKGFIDGLQSAFRTTAH